jgi:hypothetical protein
MTRIVVFYYPGDDELSKMDDIAHSIFEAHGGEHAYQEMTYQIRPCSREELGNTNHGEREIGYDVPDYRAEECRAALKKHFSLESKTSKEAALA